MSIPTTAIRAGVALGVAAAILSAATPAGADGRRTLPDTCRGQRPTAVVGAGETFVGTPGDDVILIVGDTAEVFARGGDDLVCVYDGPGDGYSSTVWGEGGDDVLLGYSGDDHSLYGGDGDDVLIGNGGHYWLEGDAGHDVLNLAGATSGFAHGGTGNDIVTGSPGDDDIFGLAGDDLLMGWGGDDEIFGDGGNDEIHGGDGLDLLTGGVGDDECIDVNDAVNGATFVGCENVAVTFWGPGGLTFG